MTDNLPALPEITVQTETDAAISLLVSSCHRQITVQRAPSGDWILAPSSALTANNIRIAIQALEQRYLGGPEREIKMAVLALTAATSRPAWMDEPTALAYVATIVKALFDFPIDVVKLACENWRRIPNHGRWWPTEQDLRVQCEEIFEPRKALLQSTRHLFQAMDSIEREDAKARAEPRTRATQPHGRTLDFYDAVVKNFGPNYAKSWLSSRTCDFGPSTIYTHGLGVERLSREFSGLLKRHGVTVERCEKVTKRFYEAQDLLAQFEAPKKKGKREWTS